MYDSRSVTTDGVNETNSDCRVDNGTAGCQKMKNALQTDPVATGPADSRYVTKSYIGDLDGNVWRFDIGLNGSNNPIIQHRVKLYASGADQPIFNSMATVNVGPTAAGTYSYGTGSDLLPQTDKNTVYRLLGILDSGATGSKTMERLLTKTGTSSVTSDERVTAFPAVAGRHRLFHDDVVENLVRRAGRESVRVHLHRRVGLRQHGRRCGRQTDTPLVKTIVGKRATAPTSSTSTWCSAPAETSRSSATPRTITMASDRRVSESCRGARSGRKYARRRAGGGRGRRARRRRRRRDPPDRFSLAQRLAVIVMIRRY